MTGRFKLYPEERHWWSFADYQAVLDTMHDLQPKRVLEFGPGSSTLALIEGGAIQIDTCEDDPSWAEVYETRLQGRFPSREYPTTTVLVHRYVWADPLRIDGLAGVTWDLALIDGPLGTDRRPVVVRYALERCAAVLVPTEDKNSSLRATLKALAAELGWDITIRETGPLSGGFALFTRPAVVEPTAAETVEPSAPADTVTFGFHPDPVVPIVAPVTPPLSRRAQKRQRKGKPGA
jgi:hypothetical protein